MIEEIDATQPTLIVIRHGETKYTNKFPDLTPEGIEQIENSAIYLKNLLAKYSCFAIVASPAVRAQGSAEIFIKKSKIPTKKILISNDIRPYDIMDLDEFLEFQRPFDPKVFAEMWLNNAFFDSERNHLTEKRKDVNMRAMKFLNRYLTRVQEKKDKEPVCTILHTHTEILANYLNPVEKTPGPQNGETVIIQSNQYNPRDLTIVARSKLVKARFNSSNSFELLA